MTENRNEKTILHRLCPGGYLTVWLTMLLAVLLPLLLTLVEGSRSGGIRLESEVAMEVAMNSCFAEYHRQLFDRYHLLAIDCSYGSNQAATSRTAQHLQSYLEKNLDPSDVMLSGVLYRDFLGLKPKDVSVEGVVFMTDRDGEVFRRRAAETVKYDTGVAETQEMVGLFQSVEKSSATDSPEGTKVAALAASIDPDKPFIGEILELSGTENSPENQSILKKLFGGKRKTLGFLNHLIDDDENLSQRELTSSELAGERVRNGTVNSGNLLLSDKEGIEDTLEPILFLLYLKEHFSSYTDQRQGDALAYQLEYLACGKDADVSNLKQVLTELVVLRSCLDYAALRSDAKLSMEADAVATLISVAILNPEAEPGIREALLLVWAVAEGYHDVRVLVEGGKVPFFKESGNWYYGNLRNMLSGADKENISTDHGLGYEQYLVGLLLTVNQKELTLRAMNLMEAEIRRTEGNGRFRLDACIDTLQVTASVESCYGYEHTMTRIMDYQ